MVLFFRQNAQSFDFLKFFSILGVIKCPSLSQLVKGLNKTLSRTLKIEYQETEYISFNTSQVVSTPRPHKSEREN